MLAKLETLFRSDRVFVFLVVFRWAALLPALLTLRVTPSFIPPLSALLAASLVNLAISFFHTRLNRLVVARPLLIGVDLLFAASLLTLSGGSRSPYFLYALSPLLASAFFFQMRGALISAGIFTPLYFLADLLAHRFSDGQTGEAIAIATQLAAIWLIPALFAYPALLLKTVHQTSDQLTLARDQLAEQNVSLGAAHRQLRVIHELTVLLQAAPDLVSVQQRVLGAVTTGLGFRHAVVGLVDPAREELGDWVLHPVNSSFPRAAPLSIKEENGEIFKSLLERKRHRTDAPDEILIAQPALNAWLKTSEWMILPLSLREHAVGVLLVEMDKTAVLTRAREEALTNVSNQAALALGTTILCIDRAQRLAVETERNRIARDIHDTVAQSLFGIVYSLDACITMLPHQAEDVKRELADLRALASNAHDEVRRSIFDLWPSALTLDLFKSDISAYVNSCCRPKQFRIEFETEGNFDSLPSGLRRAVYRMAQEALANSARHSGAPSAKLRLAVDDGEVSLIISDAGRGFDPSAALSRSHNREHFGLHGLQERARALGGNCEIHSQPNAGARVSIRLPLERLPVHA
ncbi:MAG: hypothetical protein HFACDABA_02588 [Anaerolineales bacterium]|nr:hypothetical protein [Anaerolineales bacterium]